VLRWLLRETFEPQNFGSTSFLKVRHTHTTGHRTRDTHPTRHTTHDTRHTTHGTRHTARDTHTTHTHHTPMYVARGRISSALSVLSW
jgi:hypothetical protein